MKGPQYNAIKAVLIIAVVLVAGYFVFTGMNHNSGNTGMVIDIAKKGSQQQDVSDPNAVRGPDGSPLTAEKIAASAQNVHYDFVVDTKDPDLTAEPSTSQQQQQQLLPICSPAPCIVVSGSIQFTGPISDAVYGPKYKDTFNQIKILAGANDLYIPNWAFVPYHEVSPTPTDAMGGGVITTSTITTSTPATFIAVPSVNFNGTITPGWKIPAGQYAKVKVVDYISKGILWDTVWRARLQEVLGVDNGTGVYLLPPSPYVYSNTKTISGSPRPYFNYNSLPTPAQPGTSLTLAGHNFGTAGVLRVIGGTTACQMYSTITPTALSNTSMTVAIPATWPSNSFCFVHYELSAPPIQGSVVSQNLYIQTQ